MGELEAAGLDTGFPQGEAESREQGIGNREQGTGNREQATGISGRASHHSAGTPDVALA